MSSILTRVIRFCQRLIQTPSLPGQEGEVARLIKREMKQLPYDDVWIDEIGNVIGFVKGKGSGPSIMFTAHMDHVDPGDARQWLHPPYSGEISDGYIHGRGASDTKGAIATQVYIPALLKDLKAMPPKGDLYIAEVVLEEKGGAGSKHLVTKIKPNVVILGEPTENEIKIGHRGRLEVIVEIMGKAAHASVPEEAINPHYLMAEFLLRLKEIKMEKDHVFISSVAPTLYYTDQTSSNVIPGKATVHLDWRTIPGETKNEVFNKLLAIKLPTNINLSIAIEHLKAYTGMNVKMEKARPPYALNKETPLVQLIKQAIEEILHRVINIKYWNFSTDAGYFIEQGIPVLGFSPCEERYAHTCEDKVNIALMEEALQCYPAIIDAIATGDSPHEFKLTGDF